MKQESNHGFPKISDFIILFYGFKTILNPVFNKKNKHAFLYGLHSFLFLFCFVFLSGQESFARAQHNKTQSSNSEIISSIHSDTEQEENPLNQNSEKQKNKLFYTKTWKNWSFDLYSGANMALALGNVEANPLWDAYVNLATSYITEQGNEFGISLNANIQKDNGRYGYRHLVGSCPPGIADCATISDSKNQLQPGAGYSIGIYNAGSNYEREIHYQLEKAYLFLNTAYGAISIGRQYGAARLLSIVSPYTFYLTRASNSPTDFTKLAAIKTYNNASGFAAKLSYISPEWLGVKLGISYTPKVDVCGVDFCVKTPQRHLHLLSPLFPKIENVFEFAASFQHHLQNGIDIQMTASHARGEDTTSFANFSELQSSSAGMSLGYKNFTFGASFLRSNNGWRNQLTPNQYYAYDFGIAYEHKDWKLSFELASANDDISKLTAKTAQAGIKFNFFKRFSIGGGIQKQFRDSPKITHKGRKHLSEEATTVFIEGGVDF